MKTLIITLTICTLCALNSISFGQITILSDNAPAITVQPIAPAAGCEGASIHSITLTATGTDSTFQWQEFTTVWANITNGGVYSGALTNTLVLTNPTAAFNGRQYRCIVSGTCTPPVTSNAVAVTILTNPNITVQPANATACSGSPTSFTTTVTGAGLTYQWQISGPWTNLLNGGVYSNVTTNTMNISDITGLGGQQYRCVVTGTCGTPATSNAATLTENLLPAITAQPTVPVAICELAGTLTMNVGASGTAITYQWQENGINITNGGIYTGATTNTLVITNPTSTINGNLYQCVVSGTCLPPVTSNAVTVTVNANATITLQPTAQSVCATGSITAMADTFNITAAGATYQWQVNPGSGWSNLADTGVYSGALTNTLTITAPATTLNGYNYRCQLTTLVGGCTSNSNSAGLTVNPIPNNPTLYLDNMPNDTAHYCVSGPGVVIKLSPTQSSSFSYDLQSYPAGASISNLAGNNGALLFPAQPWGQYQIIITNTGTTCAILKLQ